MFTATESYFVIFTENPALISQLPFQSKLGKCRVFPEIVVPGTVAHQF